ncbi:MAG TPA: fibronectin type III domain-containing protein [Candidatus Sulfotelmatobacter sp.]|nr:fibronectin type III domain-containing protein [Candidatus Sulfotelmatobacter sp.]
MKPAKPSRLTIAIATLTISLLFAQSRLASARQGSSSSQTSANPTLETVTDSLAFISWTTPNPGGTILHYAIAHYGKDPSHLDLTAKSPTRINLSRSDMVFRVRIGDLEPGTTYYYKVSSEQASGLSDPVTSGVNKFTTRPANWMSASK